MLMNENGRARGQLDDDGHRSFKFNACQNRSFLHFCLSNLCYLYLPLNLQTQNARIGANMRFAARLHFLSNNLPNAVMDK